jgi:hypothetical protein
MSKGSMRRWMLALAMSVTLIAPLQAQNKHSVSQAILLQYNFNRE